MKKQKETRYFAAENTTQQKESNQTRICPNCKEQFLPFDLDSDCCSDCWNKKMKVFEFFSDYRDVYGL